MPQYDEPRWCHLYCPGRDCHRHVVVRLAPLSEAWGMDDMAVLARLRSKARCTRCGHLGQQTTMPSWGNSVTGWAAMPTDVEDVTDRLLGRQ